MAQLLVRNLDDDVKQRLVARAKAANRSTEEEVRQILAKAVSHPPGESAAVALSRVMKGRGLTDREHREFMAAIEENRRQDLRSFSFDE